MDFVILVAFGLELAGLSHLTIIRVLRSLRLTRLVRTGPVVLLQVLPALPPRAGPTLSRLPPALCTGVADPDRPPRRPPAAFRASKTISIPEPLPLDPQIRACRSE